MAKDAGLRIRVEAKLRSQFVQFCREEGITASQVIRDYMKNYIEQRIYARQGTLFRIESIDKSERS